jgi:para-nitrobenzyl esterase
VLAAIVSDWFFRVPAIRVAEARGGNTWMYRFDYRSPALGGTLGSGHGVEIPFVFDTIDEPSTHARIGDDPPQAVADTVHGVWVRFITDGDPGWPAYDTATRTTALLAEKQQVVSDPAGDERALWDSSR